MKNFERDILQKLRELLDKKVNLQKMILFGSRARDDADEFSDMDVLIIIDGFVNDTDRDFVSDCAWEIGFENGIVIVPVVYDRNAWENGPDRYSLLAIAVDREGISV